MTDRDLSHILNADTLTFKTLIIVITFSQKINIIV